MSKFIYNYIHNLKKSSNFTLLTNPFSSLSKIDVKDSFTINYMINSCGLTQEKAISASKFVKFDTSEKPDSVLSFFISQGFTKFQISNLTKQTPALLLCNTEKTLKPKFEFFKSKGCSNKDIAEIFSKTPGILKRSLENHLIPSFELFCKLVRSNEKGIVAIKRFGGVLLYDLETYLVPNIEILKEYNVSEKNIEYFLTNNPRTFMTTSEKFRNVVDNVKKLGFDSNTLMFISAVHALRSMKKCTWDKKVEVYKKWGWSEHDVASAFKKYTWCMTFSESKIDLIMDFWVNEMGWKASYLANRPVLIAYSLKKRIVPRCKVYKSLVSEGLVKASDVNLMKFLESTENVFLEKFVNCYENEAPRLLKIYEENMGLEE